MASVLLGLVLVLVSGEVVSEVVVAAGEAVRHEATEKTGAVVVTASALRRRRLDAAESRNAGSPVGQSGWYTKSPQMQQYTAMFDSSSTVFVMHR